LSHLIRPVRGVARVPLRAEFALTVTFSAGVSLSAAKPAAAAKLIRFLSGPGAARAIDAAGMRPVYY
jgi:hypothetical protein